MIVKGPKILKGTLPRPLLVFLVFKLAFKMSGLHSTSKCRQTDGRKDGLQHVLEPHTGGPRSNTPRLHSLATE